MHYEFNLVSAMATDASWPDSGRTRSRNTGQRCATVSVVWARHKVCAQVAGACDAVYGSDDQSRFWNRIERRS